MKRGDAIAFALGAALMLALSWVFFKGLLDSLLDLWR